MQDYKIISDSEKDTVTLKVKELLKEGWEPLGSCQYADMMYTQTLVMR